LILNASLFTIKVVFFSSGIMMHAFVFTDPDWFVLGESLLTPSRVTKKHSRTNKGRLYLKKDNLGILATGKHCQIFPAVHPPTSFNRELQRQRRKDLQRTK
jgi:hypothetical protein